MPAVALTAVLILGGTNVGAQEAIDGKRLYERTCATCHGRDGRQAYPGRMRALDSVSEAEFRDFLLSKRSQERPTRAQDRIKAALTDAEIDALAGYVGSFRKP